jgi:hypothetical protein
MEVIDCRHPAMTLHEMILRPSSELKFKPKGLVPFGPGLRVIELPWVSISF